MSRHEALNSAARASYELFRQRILPFTIYVNPGFEPSTWHKNLCEILHQVERGEIKRLAISVPPQHGKTAWAGMAFPLWMYAKNPDLKVMYMSFATTRAEEVSWSVREIARSDRFSAVFPERILHPDRQALDMWSWKEGRGFFKAVGRGGSITGQGGDLMILDDIIKDNEEADSEVIREKAWNWYMSTVYSRRGLDTPIIMIGTRWHEDDLIGRVIKHSAMNAGSEPWTVVSFPALGANDEPLWPERRSLDWYLETRATLPKRWWQAMYQCTPSPEDGAVFKREWFKSPQKRAPDLITWVRCWDLAITTKSSSDYTVGAKVGVDEFGTIWIADIVRMRGEWPEVRQAILNHVALDGRNTIVGVEATAFQAAAVQDLQRNPLFLSVPLFAIRPSKDKYTRAMVIAGRAAEGKCRIVGGGWNDDFIEECIHFPHGAHDDQVDAVASALHLVSQMRGQTYERENWFKQIHSPNSYKYFRLLSGATEREIEEEFAPERTPGAIAPYGSLL